MQTLAEEIGKEITGQPWSTPFWTGSVGSGGMSISQYNPERKNGSLHIWDMPRTAWKYTVAIDPSMGTENGDPAAIQVVTDWGHQVAEFPLDKSSLEAQAGAAIWLAEFYNEAVLAVEVNGLGSVLLKFIDAHGGYKKLWHDKCVSPGFTTTQRSRSEMIKTVQMGLRMGEPMMRSYRLKSQVESFLEEDRDAEDDLFMAFGIAVLCHSRWRSRG